MFGRPTWTSATLLSVVVLLFVVSACGTSGPSTSSITEIFVDLGVEGNARARREVQDFMRALDQDFVRRDPQRKAVLISGFNPFGGASSAAVTVNVSGDLVSRMERSDRDADHSVAERTVAGARIVRTVTQMGAHEEDIDIWYFKGDTTYVTPAMILIAVARIVPDRVINLGQGSSNIIEVGAINATRVGARSYDRYGLLIEELTPRNGVINEAPDAPPSTRLSWDPAAMEELDGFTVAAAARPDNDYICNATAKVLADALQGFEVRYLEDVTLPPVSNLDGTMRHTFIHLAPQQNLEALEGMIRRLVGASFAEVPN